MPLHRKRREVLFLFFRQGMWDVIVVVYADFQIQGMENREGAIQQSQGDRVSRRD